MPKNFSEKRRILANEMLEFELGKDVSGRERRVYAERGTRTTFRAFLGWLAKGFCGPVERKLFLFLSILVEPYRFVLRWYALSFALF